MKKILLFVPAVLLLLGACGGKSANKNGTDESDYIPVKIAQVLLQDFVVYGEYYGNVFGIKEASVDAYGGGKVEELYYKEGDRVSAGTSLGRVDSERAVLAFEQAQISLQIASENYELQKKLFAAGSASKSAVDQAHNAWLNSQSVLLNAKKNRDGALCLSPIEGVIVARYVDQYDEIPPNTPVFRIAQLDRIRVIIGISEKEMDGVREGNKAMITFNMLPDDKFEGTVVRLARAISPATLTFQAEVQFNNPEGKIMSGITAHVMLVRKVLKQAIVVPTSALLVEGDSHYVMLEANAFAVKALVEVGPSNHTHTVILSGIKVNDNLIVENNNLVKDGSPVSVQK